jgi:hypothetical protein
MTSKTIGVSSITGEVVLLPRDKVIGHYDFFSPQVMQLEEVLTTPLSTEDLITFQNYVSSREERTILPLSSLEIIMDFFGPTDPDWYVNLIVDEGVLATRTALSRLGLYTRIHSRRAYMMVPNVSEYNNLFQLDLRDPGRGIKERWELPIGMFKTRNTLTEEIRQRALRVEWVNILYGILESATLKAIANIHDRFEKADAGILPMLQDISWGDMADYIPPYVQTYGLHVTRDASLALEWMELSTPTGMLADYVAILAGRYHAPLMPFHHTHLGYEFEEANMDGLVLPLTAPLYYVRALEWNVARMNRDNARDTILALGLAPLLKGGKRTDINNLLEPISTAKFYDKLVEIGLNPLDNPEEWNILEARYIEPGLLDKTYDGSVAAKIRLQDLGLRMMMDSVIGTYSETASSLLRRGYEVDEDIVPQRYKKGKKYRVNVLYLPAIVHTQILFRYPNYNPKGIIQRDYSRIAEYMRETIGLNAMGLIADALMSYVEYTKDTHPLSFISILAEELGKGGSEELVRLPR